MTRISFFLITALFFTGCSTYFSISNEEFIKQVTHDQKKVEAQVSVYAAPVFFASRYNANSIQKILCRDKNGELVYLIPDQNTELEITSKSTKDIVTMYFDTAFLEGSKLVGLRSRLITSMTREIEVTDIEKIEIYTEFPSTEKYTVQ